MDITVTRHNIDERFESAKEKAKVMLRTDAVIKLSIVCPSAGNWSMSRLWYSWMKSTGDYMAGRNAVMPLFLNPDGTYAETRPFNESDAHELFTIKWLGTASNGKRYSWAKSLKPGEDDLIIADEGQRFYALERQEEWMTDRGIKFLNPRESDYRSLIAKMSEMEDKGLL